MFYYDSNLEFYSASLLNITDAVYTLNSKDLMYFGKPYWLHKDRWDIEKNKQYIVNWERQIQTMDVCYLDCYIRPVLEIRSLGSFKIGNIFSIGNYKFKIITPDIAWLYKQDIGKDYFDDKSNDYETSHVKQIIDAWFEDLKKEMK